MSRRLAILLIALLLTAILSFVASCAVRRWERRLRTVEDTADTVEYVADKAEKVIGKSK